MKLSRSVLATVALLWLGGCGFGDSLPETADPKKARQALTLALETWKSGESPRTLVDHSPEIRVADEDWIAGLKLVNHQAKGAERLVGVTLQYPVVLSLKTARGRVVKKNVVYSVGTDPIVSIVRQE